MKNKHPNPKAKIVKRNGALPQWMKKKVCKNLLLPNERPLISSHLPCFALFFFLLYKKISPNTIQIGITKGPPISKGPGQKKRPQVHSKSGSGRP